MKLALITLLLVLFISLFAGCTPGITNSPPYPPNNPPTEDIPNTEVPSGQPGVNTTIATGIDDVFAEDYADITPPAIPS